MNWLNQNFLVASMFWGAVSSGYCIYGWRQRSTVPLVAGVLMGAASWFVTSALMMSLICLAVMAAAYWLARQGY
ncbi:MAG: hypothetical protein KGJ60_00740 [Verrucomicrobiota bacterium]|nr:hypothetical protein [Verrucomicrobiota bacterium]